MVLPLDIADPASVVHDMAVSATLSKTNVTLNRVLRRSRRLGKRLNRVVGRITSSLDGIERRLAELERSLERL